MRETKLLRLFIIKSTRNDYELGHCLFFEIIYNNVKVIDYFLPKINPKGRGIGSAISTELCVYTANYRL